MSKTTSNHEDPAKDNAETPETSNAFVNNLAYPEGFAQYAVALCESASRYINIMSPDLDHAAFDQSELADALSTLARGSRQTQIRILVQDPRRMVSLGHRLLSLAKRLPSTIAIQRLSEHPDWKGQSVITRDLDGVLYRHPDGQAFYEPQSRASAARHIDLFNELWRFSEVDPEFRTLQL